MGFICPRCLSRNLQTTSSIELPSDSRSDEISVQILKCSECDFAGLGVYEESRRGRLDSEKIYHRGYYVNNSLLEKVRKLIRLCPNQKKSSCKCKVHLSLGRTNEFGRWIWLDSVPIKEKFQLQIV